MFWIAVSSLCFGGMGLSQIVQNHGNTYWKPLNEDRVCIQTPVISTSPITAKDGETVYKVCSKNEFKFSGGGGDTSPYIYMSDPSVKVTTAAIPDCPDEYDKIKNFPCISKGKLDTDAFYKWREAEERERRSEPYKTGGDHWINGYHWDGKPRGDASVVHIPPGIEVDDGRKPDVDLRHPPKIFESPEPTVTGWHCVSWKQKRIPIDMWNCCLSTTTGGETLYKDVKGPCIREEGYRSDGVVVWRKP